MKKIYFKLEEIPTAMTGIPVPTIVKYSGEEGQPHDREEWCTVLEIDQLFDTCVRKWGANWDLNKVCTAIQEADFQ